MGIDFPNGCIYFAEYRPHKTSIQYEIIETSEIGKGYLAHLPEGNKFNKQRRA